MSDNIFKQIRRTIRIIDLLRPANSAIALAPAVVGYFSVVNRLHYSELIIISIVIILIHSYATLDNDLNDMAVDRANHRTGILLDGGMTVEQARLFTYVLAGGAIFAASFSEHRFIHLGFIIVLTGLSWIYNAKPLQLSKRPVGSIVVLGLTYGAVPLLYGFSAAGGHITTQVLTLAGAWFVMRTGVSILKDFKDAAGDKAHHKQTFLLRYGSKRVIWYSFVSVLISFPVIALIYHARTPHVSSAMSLIAAGGSLLAVYALIERARLLTTTTYTRLNQIFHACLKLNIIIESTLGLWLIFS